MKLSVVERIARTMAPAPKAAVPPSVRHAACRLTRKPQMISAEVKSNDRAALHTFRVSSASGMTLVP